MYNLYIVFRLYISVHCSKYVPATDVENYNPSGRATFFTLLQHIAITNMWPLVLVRCDWYQCLFNATGRCLCSYMCQIHLAGLVCILHLQGAVIYSCITNIIKKRINMLKWWIWCLTPYDMMCLLFRYGFPYTSFHRVHGEVPFVLYFKRVLFKTYCTVLK